MNRARPMAARLKKKLNKPRVNHNPRSAHGRAVNKILPISMSQLSEIGQNTLGSSGILKFIV